MGSEFWGGIISIVLALFCSVYVRNAVNDKDYGKAASVSLMLISAVLVMQ